MSDAHAKAWKLVPVEPDGHMIRAGVDERDRPGSGAAVSKIYAAMLAASPPGADNAQVAPVTEGMVEAFMAELQAQGVAFDDFSPPIYPAKIISAVLAIADNTPSAPAEPAEGEAPFAWVRHGKSKWFWRYSPPTAQSGDGWFPVYRSHEPASPDREAATREAVIEEGDHHG